MSPREQQMVLMHSSWTADESLHSLSGRQVCLTSVPQGVQGLFIVWCFTNQMGVRGLTDRWLTGCAVLWLSTELPGHLEGRYKASLSSCVVESFTPEILCDCISLLLLPGRWRGLVLKQSGFCQEEQTELQTFSQTGSEQLQFVCLYVKVSSYTLVCPQAARVICQQEAWTSSRWFTLMTHRKK